MDASEDYLKWTGQLSLENNGGFAQFYGNIGRKLTGYNTMRFSARTTDPSRDFYATYSRDMGTGVMFQVLCLFYLVLQNLKINLASNETEWRVQILRDGFQRFQFSIHGLGGRLDSDSLRSNDP